MGFWQNKSKSQKKTFVIFCSGVLLMDANSLYEEVSMNPKQGKAKSASLAEYGKTVVLFLSGKDCQCG
jgi:hypothetical protein